MPWCGCGPESSAAKARRDEFGKVFGQVIDRERGVPIADINAEPESIRRLYGVDSTDEHQRYYATQALRARRMVGERTDAHAGVAL